MNILIVEDDTIQSQLIKRYLKSKIERSIIYEAIDGIEALEYIDAVKIDLILIDMSLPRMGGIDCLRNLKTKHKGIPFIVISGGLSGDLIDRLYTLGAVDCLKKPFYLEELHNKISRLMCA